MELPACGLFYFCSGMDSPACTEMDLPWLGLWANRTDVGAG